MEILSFLVRAARRLRLAQALAACLFLLVAATVTAHHRPASEEDENAELKAAFLRNFIEFAYWPQDVARLGFCTVGEDNLGRALDEWPRLRIRGMQIEVRRHLADAALGGCHVIYVSAAAAKQLGATIAATRGRPVLVVADLEGAAQLGASLSLHETPAGRLAFDVNLSAAKSVGMRLDSRLIRLARRVH